jgi:hypothetical protein
VTVRLDMTRWVQLWLHPPTTLPPAGIQRYINKTVEPLPQNSTDIIPMAEQKQQAIQTQNPTECQR